MTLGKKIIILTILTILATVVRVPQNQTILGSSHQGKKAILAHLIATEQPVPPQLQNESLIATYIMTPSEKLFGNPHIFIIVISMLVLALMYFVLQRLLGFGWATLFTGMYAFFVPIIVLNRNGTHFEVMYLLICIVLALTCKKFFEYNKYHMRELSLVIIMFLLAFTSYNIINYEMLFKAENKGMREGIATMVSKIDATLPIFLIDDNNKWFLPLSTLYKLNITVINSQETREKIVELENGNQPFIVLATGDYDKVLSLIKNIAYTLEKNLSFVIEQLETGARIPLKKTSERHVFSVLKVASSISKL